MKEIKQKTREWLSRQLDDFPELKATLVRVYRKNKKVVMQVRSCMGFTSGEAETPEKALNNALWSAQSQLNLCE